MKLVAVLFALLGLVGLAHADEPERLLSDGVMLRRQGKDEAAMAQFRRSYALKPTARALAQIALAEQALGRWVDADRDLRQSLRVLDDDWIARNRTTLQNALAVIANHLAQLAVTGPAGADLFINGARVATLPLTDALRLLPGRYTVELRMSGHAKVSRVVVLDSRAIARESFTLPPTQSSQLPAKEPRPSETVPATNRP